VFAEDVPMFRGTFGLSQGQQAIKIDNMIQRSPQRAP